ncbi:hypothetical protein IVA79_30935 [Bradyrhizobium sp. 138]|uniref:NAD(P)-dependent oxidoreductase n=1 Tax=Bradyrhizobium sp. 138 TaxID=2782615 RepID=UPI001FF95C12|nr:NAD(P)-dependent oxidoreductase [Bradyrhizobium sp. 138]MCK1738294.1 hypothetical protein [Bradyrhizobium sp. 138]
MTMANDVCAEFSHRLGILGAGRLGSALASRLKSLGLDVPLWSRRHENGAQLRAITAGTYLPVSFDRLAEVDVLFSAIPNQALLRLPSHERWRSFNGVIFASGIDSQVQRVREVLSQALVVRLSPAIPPGGGEIACIGLLDASALADHRLDLARAASELLGPVTWIDEEALYDLTTLLAGPLLTLLRSALSRTVEKSLEAGRLPIQFKDDLQDILFKQLVRRSLGSNMSSQRAESERSTPGGVTEVALGRREHLSGELFGIVELMLRRMTHLRKEQET